MPPITIQCSLDHVLLMSIAYSVGFIFFFCWSCHRIWPLLSEEVLSVIRINVRLVKWMLCYSFMFDALTARGYAPLFSTTEWMLSRLQMRFDSRETSVQARKLTNIFLSSKTRFFIDFRSSSPMEI